MTDLSWLPLSHRQRRATREQRTMRPRSRRSYVTAMREALSVGRQAAMCELLDAGRKRRAAKES